MRAQVYTPSPRGGTLSFLQLGVFRTPGFSLVWTVAQLADEYAPPQADGCAKLGIIMRNIVPLAFLALTTLAHGQIEASPQTVKWEYAAYSYSIAAKIYNFQTANTRSNSSSLNQLGASLGSKNTSELSHLDLHNLVGAQGWELVLCTDTSIAGYIFTNCVYKRPITR